MLYGCSRGTRDRIRATVPPRPGYTTIYDKGVTARVVHIKGRQFRLEVSYKGHRNMYWTMYPDVDLYDTKGQSLSPPETAADWFVADLKMNQKKLYKGKGIYKNAATSENLLTADLCLQSPESLPTGRYKVEPRVQLIEFGPDAKGEISPAIFIFPEKSISCWFDHKP